MGQFQPFPSCRYHYSGKTATVDNAEEEKALGGGWAKSPTAFDAYRGPRRHGPQHDPAKWVDPWPVEGLTEGLRKKIKAQLLRAGADFWKSPEDKDADTAAMRRAFDGIARVLHDAGLLTEQLLAEDIPRLVWDSAIAGGWWRMAAETRQDMFLEELGHYWLWRDDSRDWNMLFGPESAEWRARLLEVRAEETAQSDGSAGPGQQLEAEATPGGPQPKRTVGPDRNSEPDQEHGKPKDAATQSPHRFSSGVTSPIAARRMEAFLVNNNLEMREFVLKVGTTERTLRKFRQTGRVKLSLLDNIAVQMGMTRHSLLKS